MASPPLRCLVLLLAISQTAVAFAAQYTSFFSFLTIGCTWQPTFEFGCLEGSLVVDSVEGVETSIHADAGHITISCLPHPHKGQNMRLCTASQYCPGCTETSFYALVEFGCEGPRNEASTATVEIPAASVQCTGSTSSATHFLSLLLLDQSTQEHVPASSCEEGVFSQSFDDGITLSTCASKAQPDCVGTCTSILPTVRSSLPPSEQGTDSIQSSSPTLAATLTLLIVLVVLATLGVSVYVWFCSCRNKSSATGQAKSSKHNGGQGVHASAQQSVLTATNTTSTLSSARPSIGEGDPSCSPSSNQGFATMPRATAVHEQDLPMARAEVIPPSISEQHGLEFKDQTRQRRLWDV